MNDAPGPLFYRRLAALGILGDLGRVFKQVPISQGLSAAFFLGRVGPGTGPGKRRKIRLRAPRPPPWAGGEIAANLECFLYIYSGFSLSTHIAGSSCARLMRPGPRWFVPSFSTHPRDARARPPAPPRSAGACSPGGHAGARGRTEGPAASTLLLIQLVEYLLVPRVELSILRLRLRALSAYPADAYLVPLLRIWTAILDPSGDQDAMPSGVGSLRIAEPSASTMNIPISIPRPSGDHEVPFRGPRKQCLCTTCYVSSPSAWTTTAVAPNMWS